MASADWMKLTSPHAAGMKKHLGAEERLSVNHSNRDIDKSKSHFNIVIGCEDYADALAAMRARVKEIDKLYPPLKKKKADERVIAEMIEVKCPQEIVEKGYEAVCEYFRGVYKIQQDFFGAENVHGGFAHFDEIHTYTDKDGTKRDSLPHMHTLVSAYCEWDEPVKVKGKKTGEVRHRQGINGKHFEVKPRYNQLNGKIDEYCMKHHGITYTKGKGKEPGHGKTVETLKAEEKLHQIIAQTNAAMQQRIREQELTEQARKDRLHEQELAEQAQIEASEAISKATAEAKKEAAAIAGREAAEQAAKAAQKQVKQLQEQALAYEPEKKHFGETAAVYNARIATAQQAAAVQQRTAELNAKQQELNEREIALNARQADINTEITEKAKQMAAKPLAQAKAIIKEERTAHAATKAELSSTRAALHRVLGKLRDTFLAAFAPHRNQHNAHEKQARELRRGEDHGTLQRRNGYQSQTKEKSQDKGQPRLYQHR